MAEQTIFRLGELFCGPGGLACGALRSHSDDGRYCVKHAWSNDYDADTCETYRKNISPDNPDSVYLGDVRKLDISALEDGDRKVIFQLIKLCVSYEDRNGLVAVLRNDNLKPYSSEVRKKMFLVDFIHYYGDLVF